MLGKSFESHLQGKKSFMENEDTKVFQPGSDKEQAEQNHPAQYK